MKVPFVDLNAQYQPIKQTVLDKIEKIIERGDFILGEEVKKFEEEFAAYTGVKHGVGVASGTDALHLALLACGIGPGDEVITAANTFIATVTAMTMTNAKPVLVDIDPKTYNIDPSQIQSKITPKTKAIIPVHLCGQPADMNNIMKIAKQFSLRVIEDAAQAHGVTVPGTSPGTSQAGKKAGSYGDLACFSFYPAKNLGAYGDGGIVVTNDDQLAEKLRLLRNYGQKTKNQHVIKGFNSRLDNLQAAILRIKLRYLDQWNKQRQANARLYREFFDSPPRLKNNEVVLPAQIFDHIYHLYVILANDRTPLAEFLQKREIGAGMHYPVPIHLHQCYQDLGYRKGDFPNAEDYANRTLSLPMYPELTGEQIKWVVDSVKEFYH